jgi:hypothetical protein
MIAELDDAERNGSSEVCIGISRHEDPSRRGFSVLASADRKNVFTS